MATLDEVNDTLAAAAEMLAGQSKGKAQASMLLFRLLQLSSAVTGLCKLCGVEFDAAVIAGFEAEGTPALEEKKT